MNTDAPSYVEFGVQSNFSFLRGASKPEELVSAACLLGHAGMGLADRNTVAGVVRAWNQSKHIEVPGREEPVTLPYYPGSRLVFCDGTPETLAYPRNRRGWGNLCRLLTQANTRDESEKGAPRLYRGDLLEWGDDMSLAVLPSDAMEAEESLRLLVSFRERFGDCLWVAVSPGYGGRDHFRFEQTAALAKAAGLPLLAINDVLYHTAERRPLQDVLTAIRLNKTVAEAGLELQANAERHLKPPVEMARLFLGHPQALAETVRFASTLKFSLKELEYNYPDELTQDGATPQEELTRLTWEGARGRFPTGIPTKVRTTIEHELRIVGKLNYAGYFLTVNDIVHFAKSEGILCQGRGSAANSLICYCLGITDVGPDIMDTLFERFVSEERGEPPDIDVDFEHEKRDTVIAYIYEKYSRRRTALAAAVISYRGRSALREVAKAMGLSDDVRAALSGSIWGWSSSELGQREARAAGFDPADAAAGHTIDRANEILGFPRHLSQHVGGFVITNDRLDEMVPIVKTAMPERKMVEWDKDDLDSVGMFKVDILALGMLSCLRRCFDLMSLHYPEIRGTDQRPLALATLEPESEPVYDMICRADTLGVFQIESRAQMSMLPRLRPRKFYDLVIEVAIVRPGPIQGDMVHPYLRRREGKEKAEYVKPELKAILEKTLGVPLFQEQAMRIAIEAAGFEPARADKLRRAMATFKRTGTIDKLRDEFIAGMTAKEYPREFAERCFSQIEGFGEYGFPESHAASFALLVYASCWFKAFYPDVFCAAMLNSQPMGFYAPAQLVRDAREHGIAIREVDVNHSFWDCTLETASFDPHRIAGQHASMKDVIRARHAVRLGFRQVKGLSEEDMDRLVQRRGDGYVSVRDLWLRSCLPVEAMEKLAQADAFRSLGLDRRAALWAVKALDRKVAAERLPLFDRPAIGLPDLEPEVLLPAMPLGEHVIHDYRALALSLKAHPVSFLRDRLKVSGVVPSASLRDMANGRHVSVAGLVLVRQRPGSAKGVIFMTLEDEEGVANIVVWPKTFEKFRPIVLGARLVRVSGKLQAVQGKGATAKVIHVVAERIHNLTPWLLDLTEGAAATPGRVRIDSRGPIGVEGPSIATHASLFDGAPRSNGPRDIDDIIRETHDAMPRGRNFQ